MVGSTKGISNMTATVSEERLMSTGDLLSASRTAAGERRLSEIISGAGFAPVRRVAESALNMVLEAKP